MPDTTPNYGFTITKADGSEYQNPNDIRTPVTQIDTSLKAEETARLAIAARTTALEGTLWQAYVPTLANVTIGNGTISGRWAKIGGHLIQCHVTLTRGSTTTITGNVAIGLPIAVTANNVAGVVIPFIGSGIAHISTGGSYFMVAASAGPSGISFTTYLPSGPAASTLALWAAAVPSSQGTSDSWEFNLMYECD